MTTKNTGANGNAKRAKKHEVPEGVILGTATLRTQGRSGDVALSYPRVRDLESIALLDTDGQRAIREAMEIVRQAQEKGNSAHAIERFAENGLPPVSHVLRKGEFDPTALQTIIITRVIGG